MENKTIGQFISALRRVNGMTQRELAEKLNVSDKSVSRWERDETAPDLSLIPVIAELFGVTSDELLRGERSANREENTSFPEDDEREKRERAKSEKQIAHLLRSTREKFRIRTMIPIGIALLGLIAALICNFAFNRSTLGFYLGLAFFISAFITLRIQLAMTNMAINDAEFAGEELGRTKRSIWRHYMFYVGIILVIFAFTLPLCIYGDAYWGLMAETLVPRGLLCAAIGALICYFGGLLVDRILVRCGVYPELRKPWCQNRKLWKGVCTVLLCTLAFAILWVGFGLAFIYFVAPEDLVHGQTFDSVDAFVAYMETPKHYEWKAGTGRQEVDGYHPVSYYDADGNLIRNCETVPEETLELEKGKTVTFHWSNQTVYSIFPGREKNGGLPIKTCTWIDCDTGERRGYIIIGVFALFCLAGDVVTVVSILKHQKTGTKRLRKEEKIDAEPEN